MLFCLLLATWGMMLNPSVACTPLGFSSSPAMTSLNGSATISLDRMYFSLNGRIFSSIFALKSTGNFSKAIFSITLEADSSNLSTTLQACMISFHYLEISLGPSDGLFISVSFLTAALVILQGFPYMLLSSFHMSS